MKTTVYFVRHAKTDFSVKEEKIRPLTEKGSEDTKLVTAFLKEKNISIIYSSPYKRTIDTLKDFSEMIGLPIIEVEDFRERNVGTWVDDFEAFSKQQWDDFTHKLENGESLGETQRRNIEAFKEILKKNEGSTIVIGTHGTALSTIINYYNPSFLFEDFYRIIDKMPWIICFQFYREELKSMEEIDLI